jgi:hypothetical protein
MSGARFRERQMIAEGALIISRRIIADQSKLIELQNKMIEDLNTTKVDGKMKTPDGRVKDEIRNWLKEQGAYVFSPVQMVDALTIDLLVCWKGKFIGIEVKRPGGKATKLQLQIMENIMAAKGAAFCTDSLDHCRLAIQTIFPILLR